MMPSLPNGEATKANANVRLRCRQNANKLLEEIHIKDAMSENWHGVRAARWLKLWDAGKQRTREHLLEAFVSLYHSTPISFVDTDLGSAAPLWCTRVTTYLQISYKRLSTTKTKNKKLINATTHMESNETHERAKLADVEAIHNFASPGAADTTTTTTTTHNNNNNNIISTEKPLFNANMTVKENARVTRTGVIVQRELPNNSSSIPNMHSVNKVNYGTSRERDVRKYLSASKSSAQLSRLSELQAQEKQQQELQEESMRSIDTHETNSLLLLLIETITILVRGAHYLTQFMESGGAATLVDCLESGTSNWWLHCELNANNSHYIATATTTTTIINAVSSTPSLLVYKERDTLSSCGDRNNYIRYLSQECVKYELLSSSERHAIIRLLLYIANAGRVYRDMITNITEITKHSIESHTLFNNNSNNNNNNTICDISNNNKSNNNNSNCVETPYHLLALLHAFERECDAETSALMAEMFIALIHGHHYGGKEYYYLVTGLWRIILRHCSMERQIEVNTKAKKEWCVHYIHEQVIVEATRVLRAVQLLEEVEHVNCQRLATARAAPTFTETRPQYEASMAFTANCNGSNSSNESFLSRVYDSVPLVGLFTWHAHDNETSNTGEAHHRYCFPEDNSVIVSNVNDNNNNSNNNNSSNNSINVITNTNHYMSEAGEMFECLSFNEYLQALLHLSLNLQSTRLRVEGMELITLLTKNISLLTQALNKCLDVLDDDHPEVCDRDDMEQIRERQRRQIFAGRTVVQIMRTMPLSLRRAEVMFNTIAIRSAHFSLLKYCSMADATDSATVREVCAMIKWLAITSHKIAMHKCSNVNNNIKEICNTIDVHQCNRHNNDTNAINATNNTDDGYNHATDDGSRSNDEVGKLTAYEQHAINNNDYLCKVGRDIEKILGKSLYELLIRNANKSCNNVEERKFINNIDTDDDLSDEDCFAMMRAARTELASQV